MSHIYYKKPSRTTYICLKLLLSQNNRELGTSAHKMPYCSWENMLGHISSSVCGI